MAIDPRGTALSMIEAKRKRNLLAKEQLTGGTKAPIAPTTNPVTPAPSVPVSKPLSPVNPKRVVGGKVAPTKMPTEPKPVGVGETAKPAASAIPSKPAVAGKLVQKKKAVAVVGKLAEKMLVAKKSASAPGQVKKSLGLQSAKSVSRSGSDSVMAEQRRLNANGANLKVDGIIGPLTRAARSRYGRTASVITKPQQFRKNASMGKKSVDSTYTKTAKQTKRQFQKQRGVEM